MSRHPTAVDLQETRGAHNHGNSVELWTVAGLVVVALLVRATRLGESLWYDEVAAWFSYGRYGPGWIISNFAEPSNHIAHTLTTWCSVKLWEQALGFELALRLPALLASLGAVVCTYGMVRAVSDGINRRTAFIAAGLMAILPVAVLEGAESRGYSMMICFSALATWVLIATRGNDRLWLWGVYGVVCAAGIWAHFVTAFVPIGHAVWLTWRAARHREMQRAVRGGLGIMLAAGLSLALYGPAIPDMIAHRGMYLAVHGDEPTVFGQEGWRTLLQLGGSWYVWAAWPGLVLAIIGLVATLKRPVAREVAAAALLGLPIFLAIVWLAGSWMYARFALFAFPGVALLIAAGVEQLWRWKRPAGLAAAAIIVAASAADLVFRPVKQPLRDAAQYVQDKHSDGEAVLVIGLAHRALDMYLMDHQPSYSLRHGADLAEQLQRINPAWIVLYYPNHVSEDRYTLLAESGYVLAQQFDGWADWGNGDVVVYRRP